MRIPDEFRRCVAFVGEPYVTRDGQPSVRFGGTAFFVGMPMEGHPNFLPFLYLVTAKHVATHLQGREFIVSLNNREETESVHVTIPADRSQWWFHATDEHVDVAVFKWPGLSVQFDPIFIPTDRFLTDDIASSRHIGAGDDVFMIGLFVHLKETKKNLPIVRMGTVALMPDEPIPTGLGPTDAYLIEARSIGGLSGSPVFVARNELFLMGLMHGHWDIPPSQRDAPEFPVYQDDAEDKGKVNMGIAIVVPATKILEVLNQPELAAPRAGTSNGSDNERKVTKTETSTGLELAPQDNAGMTQA